MSLPLVCSCQCQIYQPEQPFTLGVISHKRFHQSPDSRGFILLLPLWLLLKTDALQSQHVSIGNNPSV